MRSMNSLSEQNDITMQGNQDAAAAENDRLSASSPLRLPNQGDRRLVASSSLHLTAVGLGPGDPELITIKGQRMLAEADLVFVPRSVDGAESLALRIARSWLDLPRQQVVELALPMTRDPRRLADAWRAAADRIAAHLAEAATASGTARGAYLLLGDPLLYGTFTYIWGELAEHHPQIAIAIVPGITSFAATAALTQTVLSTTDDRVAIVPASYETDVDSLRTLLADFETVILMKVGSVLPQVLSALDELNMLDAAIYAERVGMPEERVVRDVRSLRGQQRPYLSLLIIRSREARRRRGEEARRRGGEEMMRREGEEARR
jgi:precorrin-2/cobalt-factor-2 C20-methyltransferase